MSEKTVFISYSHDTPEHSERVLQLANALRAHGVDAELDRYHLRPSRGWPRWCEEQLRPEKSAFVLVICTETYRRRVEGQTPVDEGRGVFWEGGIIYSYLYGDKGNERFIPVLLPGAAEKDIPLPLRGDTRYQVKAFDLNDPGYSALYRELTGQPLLTKPPKGTIAPLPSNALPAANLYNPLPPRQVLTTFELSFGALVIWQEKLSHFLVEEATVVDPDQKFRLRKLIEEARAKIREYGGHA
jgi:hypothetical protein